MSRTLRLVGILLLVPVLLALAVWQAPRWVAADTWRARLLAAAAAGIGQPVLCDGPVTIRFWPRPMLSADGLRIEAGGGIAGRIRTIEARLTWAGLLTGRFRLDGLTLVEPDLELRRLPFAATASAWPSLTVIDGRIGWRDGSQLRQLTGVNAVLLPDPAGGAVTLDGEAQRNGTAITVSGRLTAETGGGAPRLGVSAQIWVAGDALNLTVTGTIDPAAGRLNGRLRGQARQAVTAIRALGLPLAGADGDGPGSLDAELVLDDSGLRLDRLTISLGEDRITGRLALGPGPGSGPGPGPGAAERRLELELQATRLDLDPWLPSMAEGGELGAVLASGTGHIALAADGLTLRGKLLRSARLTADLTPDRAEVTQLAVQLPGGGDLAITGDYDRATRRFTGRVEAAADNLRGIADWLGVELGAPLAGVRALSATGAIRLEPDWLTLDMIDARVEGSRLTGALRIARRDRLAVGATLRLDKAKLDLGWLTEPMATAWADRFDANLDLGVADLSLGPLALRQVQISGTLEQGAVTLRDVTGLVASELAGGGGDLQWSLNGVIGRQSWPPQLDLVGTAAPATAGRRDGGGGPMPSDRLTVTVTGPLDLLGLELEGRWYDAQVHGRLDGNPMTARWQGRIAATHDDVAALVARLGGGSPSGAAAVSTGPTGAAGAPSGTRISLSGQWVSTASDDLALRDLRLELGNAVLSGEWRHRAGQGQLSLIGSDWDLTEWPALLAGLPLASVVPGPDLMGKLDMTLARVSFGPGRLALVDLAGGADAVGLRLDRIAAQGFGGSLIGAGRISRDSAWRLRLDAQSLMTDALVQQVGGASAWLGLPSDPLALLPGARLDLTVDLAGSGTRRAAVIGGLVGRIGLVAHDGRLAGVDFGRLAPALALEDKAAIEQSLAGGSSGLARLAVAVDLANGIARLDGSDIRLGGGRMTAIGVLDLNRADLDLTLTATPDAPPDLGAVQLRLTGPLAALRRSVDPIHSH